MSVYMPAEGVVEHPRRRFFDWRFLSALAALILVGFFVWAGFRNYEIREAEAAQKDALISELAASADQIRSLEGQVSTLTNRIEGLRQRAAEDRRDAARERGRLLRQQGQMLRLLRAAGVEVASPSVSYSVPVYSGGATHSGSTGGGGGGTASTSTSTTRRTTSAPSRPTAGASGKTPSGKAKGLRKRR